MQEAIGECGIFAMDCENFAIPAKIRYPSENYYA